MKRPAAQDKTLARIKKWREQCPELTLRSTFIVGFPGETDSDFAYLLDWLEEAEIDRAGCFKYEPVAGATSNALGNHVPPEIKQERWNALMAAAEDFGAPPEAQGRHPATGHHRRSRSHRLKGPLEGRRARDRRRGVPVEPAPAARRRDRHRQDRTRGSIRSARQRRGILTHLLKSTATPAPIVRAGVLGQGRFAPQQLRRERH